MCISWASTEGISKWSPIQTPFSLKCATDDAVHIEVKSIRGKDYNTCHVYPLCTLSPIVQRMNDTASCDEGKGEKFSQKTKRDSWRGSVVGPDKSWLLFVAAAQAAFTNDDA